jgi:hypothetical protein
MFRTLAIIAALLFASSASAAESVDFGRDVVPVLTKLGCNSGACHGSFQGRGGFRLSLLGFDPAADYDALVSEARGRRLFLASPEKSLLLLKGTGQLGHGGRKKLDVNSDSYRTLVHWMNQGARRGSLPSVTKLDVQPPTMLLVKGEAKPLTVKATWSDGTVQDATKFALYESTKDIVAGVNPVGTVDGRGAGRASITVRFMGQVAAVPVSSPFSLPEKFNFPPNNFIDEHLSRDWKSLGLQPAALSTDNEFLRRVMLDLIGTLPTPAEVNAFAADTDPKKRSKLIDTLLDRPEYADYWSLKWGDLLRAHRRSLGDKGLATFNGWLKQSLRENRPADRITRELLTAQGNLFLSGPVAFWFVDKLPDEFAETTAQVFLGTRLQCAKCHHHPFEVWTQDDYHGMAAFFTRIKRKDTGENGQFGGAQSLSVIASGTWTMPITGKPVAPRVLGGKDLAASPADPRAALAEWIVAKNNPLFAKNFANRYWGSLFGRGLVDPVDDLRATNPATFPALLDALTKDFADHNFDLKHLLRTIANSRAYQLAGEVNPVRDADGEFATHRRPKTLPAEVMLDAVCAATGVPEAFDKMPLGTRAISLPDPAVASYFLDAFGRPKRVSACECERPAKADLTQILHLMNGDALQKKLAADAGRIGKLITAKATETAIIEELYLATLSRRPTAAEMKPVLAKVVAAPTRREGFEDLLWALLNCPEFGFNH